MQSHGEGVPETSSLVLNEAQLECQEYLKLLPAVFEKCTHLQKSWGPSTYSGDEVMVVVVWSHQCNAAGFLPLQYLLPVQAGG